MVSQNQKPQILLQSGTSTGLSLSGYYPGIQFNAAYDGSTNVLAIGNGYAGSFYQNPSTGVYSLTSTSSSIAAGSNANLSALMTIQPNGNVGIGTASPAGALDVENGANDAKVCVNGNCNTKFGPSATTMLTSGSGTWTVPSGVSLVKVTMLGGGGGGNSVSCTTSSGSGGCGGAASGYCIAYLTVTPGSGLSYAVGGGGGAGGAGGTTTFSTLTAYGGSSSCGAGGSTSGCQVGMTGAVATTPQMNNQHYVSYSGANAYGGWGYGGPFITGATFVDSGNSAQGYGAGGGGAACANANGSGTGGSGAGGMILLEY